MSLALSLFALLLACHQLYIQHRHNKKSLIPLPQIVLGDHKGQIFVHVNNNGIGPFIVDKITFSMDDQQSSNIEDFLDLDPKSYMHDIVGTDGVIKVVHPASHLEIFSKQFNGVDSEMDLARLALSSMTLKVTGRDVYNDKIIIERDFYWFARHINHANDR